MHQLIAIWCPQWQREKENVIVPRYSTECISCVQNPAQSPLPSPSRTEKLFFFFIWLHFASLFAFFSFSTFLNFSFRKCCDALSDSIFFFGKNLFLFLLFAKQFSLGGVSLFKFGIWCIHIYMHVCHLVACTWWRNLACMYVMYAKPCARWQI